MNLNSWRQWLALVLLVVAGLASLATSPPAFLLQRTVHGQTEIGVSGGEIRGFVRLNEEAATGPGDLHISVTGRYWLPFGTSFEGRIATGHAASPADAEWQRWTSVSVGRDGCAPGQPCDVPFIAELRPVAPVRPSLVAAWRLEARLAYHADYPQAEPEVELVVTSPLAPAMPLLALVGALGGAMLGAVLLVGSVRIGDRRWRTAARESAGALILIGMGVVLAQGVVDQSMPSEPAHLWLILGGVALAYALATRGSGRFHGHLLALAVLGLPAMLVVSSAAYRVGDVLVSIVALAAIAVIGTATLDWRRAAPIRELGDASRVTLVLTSALTVLISAWVLAVASGLTDYPAVFALVPAPAVALLLWALWRWLTGRTGLLKVSGVLLIPLTIIAFFGALFPVSGLGGPPADVAPAAVLSMVLIGAAGLLLIASGPPRREDGSAWTAEAPAVRPPGPPEAAQYPGNRLDPPRYPGPDDPPRLRSF